MLCCVYSLEACQWILDKLIFYAYNGSHLDKRQYQENIFLNFSKKTWVLTAALLMIIYNIPYSI